MSVVPDSAGYNSELHGTREAIWPYFERVARALDFYLSGDVENPLSVDAISSIRTALSTPATFMYVLMYQIIPELPAVSDEAVNDIYGDFCVFIETRNCSSPCLSIRVSTPFAFPNVNGLLMRLHNLKDWLKSVPPTISNSGIFNRKAKQI